MFARVPSDNTQYAYSSASFGPPEAVSKAAKEAIDVVESNQYSHPKGRLRLRNAIAASYSPEFNRQLDPETEILVTAGANEGVLCVAKWIGIRLTKEG